MQATSKNAHLHVFIRDFVTNSISFSKNATPSTFLNIFGSSENNDNW